MGEVTPFYRDDWLSVYGGDCREVMASLPAESVDCVVTSPPEPYWGLRDYGNDGQLGLERTPEEYVANMVAVFAEVRRVLKPSGTCWLNLGDSYAGNGKGDTYSGFNERYHGSTSQTDKQGQAGRSRVSAVQGASVQRVSRSSADYGDRLKPKDLVGIPWRVAFALQADGWYLRSDIIWSKPNPMPESVTDRPTKSHEYLFLLTKSSRYFFDADAVREANETKHLPWGGAETTTYRSVQGNTHGPNSIHQPMSHERAIELRTSGRNIRSVWTIATRPYPGAHFAVFPPELPERCIKAGSSERGVCPECGAPWERVVERRPMTARTSGDNWQEGRSEQIASGRRGRSRPGSFSPAPYVPPSELDRYGTGEAGVHRKVGGQYQKWLDANPSQTLGWSTTCEHTSSTPVPAVVLDPFAGSGTVGMVANRLSRRAILIDLNPEYLRQQMERNAQTPLGLGAA